MLKVGFHTLGCKVNQYETQALIELFEKREYKIVDFNEIADIYIINTCTVTNIADKKSRKMLSRAKSMNENAVVVAMGCYAQIAREELTDKAGIDLIIGNTKKNEVVNLVEKYLNEKSKINTVEDMTDNCKYEHLNISKNYDKERIHIKIQDGCNQFCSYCIIPFTRGRVRSRDADDIIREVTEIVKNGYKEIILTGIHLASYGVEFAKYSLIDLLEELDKIDGLKRIRLGSLEPTLITEAFVKRLGKLKKLCPHFHLSLQSGCDETLKRMNRKYNTSDYEKSVMILRQAYDAPSITTDIIVGFPGEMDEEFNETLAFVKKIAFSDIHVFKYSKRKGTKAAGMKEQVDENIKNERSKILINEKENLHNLFLESFIGATLEVLFEETVIINNEEYYIGHTTNYIKVILPKKNFPLENKIISVRLKEVINGNIIGGDSENQFN